MYSAQVFVQVLQQSRGGRGRQSSGNQQQQCDDKLLSLKHHTVFSSNLLSPPRMASLASTTLLLSLTATFILLLALSGGVRADIEPAPLPEIERCDFTNTHELRRNKNCLLWGSNPYKYCDSDDQLCKEKTSVPFRPDNDAQATIGNNQQCAKGFHPGESNGNSVNNLPDGKTDKRCFALANYGCSVSDTVSSSTVCLGFDATTGGSCPTPTTPAETNTVVGLGKECGKKDADDKNIVCGYNLFCNANRVCEKASVVGEPCGTSDKVTRTCVNGLTCINRRCREKYSIPTGQPCDRDKPFSCASGYCTDANVCGETLTQTTCSKDADCVPQTRLNTNFGSSIYTRLDSTNAVCFVEEPFEIGKTGTCSAVYQPAAADLERCLFSDCQNPLGNDGFESKCKETVSPDGGIFSGTVPKDHPCQQQWIRKMCTRYCAQQPDRRYAKDVPYIFDCSLDSLQANKMGNNDCSVTTQFKNCAAIRQYKSGGNRAHGSASAMVGIIAIVSSVIVMMLA